MTPDEAFDKWTAPIDGGPVSTWASHREAFGEGYRAGLRAALAKLEAFEAKEPTWWSRHAAYLVRALVEAAERKEDK
jgi:hypothetical protein